jgi:hypothetical protein
MATYRFKQGAGKHRMAVRNGKKVDYRLLKPGEVVELTDEQYQACKDKFEAGEAEVVKPSSAELRAMADEREKEEKAEADKAKAAALAKAKEAEAAALAAKAAEDKAAKGAADKKG